MIESILTSLSLGLLKYFADKAGVQLIDYINLRLAYLKADSDSKKYHEKIDKPLSREERRKAEDEMS